MGVDLALFPISSEFETGGYSFSRLEVDRRHELWEPVQALPSNPFGSLRGYVRDEYGSVTHDSYGSALRYVFAKDFARLGNNFEVYDSFLNRAVWAYLAALEPETKIVLYWH